MSFNEISGSYSLDPHSRIVNWPLVSRDGDSESSSSNSDSSERDRRVMETQTQLYEFLHSLHSQLFETHDGPLHQQPHQPRLIHPLYPLAPHIQAQIDARLKHLISLSLPASTPLLFASTTPTPPDTNNMNQVAPSQLGEHNHNHDHNSGNTNHTPLGAEYHPNRRGAPCGHVFQEGEGVYWCRNCALDETCVLCHHCFHASNHEGHDTTFHISYGNGCCDCGDAQAWRLPVICAFHSDSSDTLNDGNELPIAVPESVIANLRATIATVLDFVIDTFNSSPTDFSLPTTTAAILAANPPEPILVSTIAANSSFIATPTYRPATDMFACILWNDEDHTFDEVIMKVEAGINCSSETASQIAVRVDSVGRDVIATNYQTARLLSVARTINEDRSNGLNVTIRTVRETFREYLSAYLVSWIRDLPSRVRGQVRSPENGRVYASVVLAVRKVICEELCAPRRKLKDMMLHNSGVSSISGSSNDSSGSGADSGSAATATAAAPAFSGAINDNDDDIPMGDSSSLSVIEGSDKSRWRLDYLIGFDSRLWKDLRGTMKGLYIESLIISGDEYKRAMAIRMSYTYPIIANSYLIWDREYDLSMMTFTVQLFTVPTIAEYLMKNSSIVFCLFATLKAFLLSDYHDETFPYNNLLKAIRRANKLIRPSYTKLTFEQHGDRVYKKTKYNQIFNDIKFFVAAPPVRMSLFRNGDLSEFAGFLDLCRVLQGMYQQKRHIRTHVEYESQAWTNSFYLGANVSRVLEHIGDAFAPTCKSKLKENLAALIRAIKLTLKVLDDWCTQEQLQEFHEWDTAVTERTVQAQRSGTPFTPPIRSLDGFINISYAQLPPQRVLDFKSLGRSLSLHCPLHWTLAKLLSCLPLYGSLLGAGAVSLAEIMTVTEIEEPKQKDLSDLSFVQDLDSWDPSEIDQDNATLPAPLTATRLLNQITQEDRTSRILDHPLRAEVFLSQIRTGLWVRNGLSMRSQLLYFKYVLLREMYDLDIFLLQSFAVIAGPDRFISTILDRYDIRAWFEANPAESAKKFFNEQSPSIGLAEDLLNLLVNILTERARISAMTVEEQARREIIHVLATSGTASGGGGGSGAGGGGIPYSKISEMIPFEITRMLQGLPITPTGAAATVAPSINNYAEEFYLQPCKSIDEILGQVAVFKPPSLTNDKGLYELKDEYYDEVNAWFHHYTRSQREEVEAMLCRRLVRKASNGVDERGVASSSLTRAVPSLRDAAKTGSLNATVASSSWKQVNEVAKQYGLFLPKIVAVSSKTGFAAIDLFVAGKSFSILLLMALYNLTKGGCKSDHAIASIVHLLLVAVEIDLQRTDNLESGKFIDEAARLHQFEALGKTPVSLIEVVLGIIDNENDEAFKDHVEKLSLFIVRIASFGQCAAMDQIVAWQTKFNTLRSAVAAENEDSGSLTPALSEKELRKEESKKRQAALLAKFAAQQQSFLNENQADGDSEDDDNDLLHEEMDADKSSKESNFLEESRTWNFPGGNCIVCQEEFTKDKLYGMLCFSQPCYIERSRFVDFRDPDTVLSAINTPLLSEQFETPGTAVFSTESSSSTGLYQKFPRSLEFYPTGEHKDTELYTSSCGHMMHSECLEKYFTSIEHRQSQEHRLHAESIERGEFLCPLCKSLGNIMLPIRNNSKIEEVNWSGSSSEQNDRAISGLIPITKGGVKNSLTNLRQWFTNMKPKLVESLDRRSKMQMEDIEAGVSVIEPSSASAAQDVSNASSNSHRSPIILQNSDASIANADAVGAGIGGQRPIMERFLNVFGRDMLDRRPSDASSSSNDDLRGEQPELQDLIDRLMTPLIRLTDDCLTNGLLKSLKYTILSLERSVRGSAAKNHEENKQNGSLIQVHVLEQLNSNTLIFLRVLTEAILQLNEFQSTAEEYDKGAYPDANTDLQIFFAGIDSELYPASTSLMPQLELTGFSTLVGITFANDDPRICDDSNDIFKWIGLAWCSEVVRTIVAAINSVSIHGDTLWFKNNAVLKSAKNIAFPGKNKQENNSKGKVPMTLDNEMMDLETDDIMPEDAANSAEMTQFLMFIMSHMSFSEDVAKSVINILPPYLLYALIRSVTLPFLRSSAIYLYARFYLIPPTGSAGLDHQMPSKMTVHDEFEQLRLYLQLPTLWKLCSTETTTDPFLSNLIGNWVSASHRKEVDRLPTYKAQLSKASVRGEDYDTYRLERSITLQSPAIISLIGLPNGIENLFADSFRRICNNCQKPISDPALCLICGTLVCALSFCCHKDKKGECNNHMKQCSGDIGIFFLIKRFNILLLHNEKGHVIDPPYLDIHGEVDVSRRKGSRQFLNLKRYDEIRKLWLKHGLASNIARSVEAVVSSGGWTQY
ncbi:hypothetical protein HK100_003039 [Physocladia obscura]|uniref:E3 ubiquitin-protein ligase n=1 Tax=Physocladia obscura TaxID=109957 RepID=A0AAD5XJW0_9FUNG|nr:hypothetical protein HK100_003039 [Physocladia obscura]